MLATKREDGDSGTKQYPGWPLTIDQIDNYGREAKAYLPTLVVRGQHDPVVKVIDESDGRWVYALRIKVRNFVPRSLRREANDRGG